MPKLSRLQFSQEEDRKNIHKNARLTPSGRERIVRQVAGGQTPEAVAEAACGFVAHIRASDYQSLLASMEAFASAHTGASQNC
jgi:hypothetical protein